MKTLWIYIAILAALCLYGSLRPNHPWVVESNHISWFEKRWSQYETIRKSQNKESDINGFENFLADSLEALR